MGVRESLNRRPGLVAAVGLLVVGAALLFIRRQVVSHGEVLPAMAFYTIDDGKTWFKSEAVPGEVRNDGKTAIKCFVFKTSGGKEFVGYLQRTGSPPKATTGKSDLPEPGAGSSATSLMIKRPGESEWIPAMSAAANEIYNNVIGPNGEKGVEQVIAESP
jgi:hypothetical protein